MAAEFSDPNTPIYTRNPDRIKFTSSNYPFALRIVTAIQKIPWDRYHFHGESTFEYEVAPNDDEDEDTFVPSQSTYTAVTIPVTAKYTHEHVPYIIFGGACYEWLNFNMPPEDRFLSNFTDLTGDIDVRLFMPHVDHKPVYANVQGSHRQVDILESCYIEGRPNELLTHLLDWITRHVVEQLRSGVIDTDHLVRCEPVLEGALLAPPVHLGNRKLWVTQQFTESEMTKIQITCQMEGMTKPDHVVEFVLSPAKRAFFLNNRRHMMYQTVAGLRIQTIDDLFEGNRSSLMERTPETTRGYEHKYLNHVQRLKFLNMYFANKYSLETIVCYLFLLLYLTKDAGWEVFATSTHHESIDKIKYELYGNVLRILTEYVQDPANFRSVMRIETGMNGCLIGDTRTHAFVRTMVRGKAAVKEKNGNPAIPAIPAVAGTLPELIALFTVPPVHRLTRATGRRICDGHECVLSGGRTKRRRTKRSTKRRFKV